MNRQARGARMRGFSLIELAVVLLVIGASGMLLWQFLPRLKSLPVIAKMTAPTLTRAEAALNGFILANSRLPCPDSNGTGVEDCSVSAGVAPVTVGWLPHRTLGLSLSEPVRYGVYRAPALAPAALTTDGDLAVKYDRYQPLLPSGVTSTQINGLDFCAALRSLAATPGTVLTTSLVLNGTQTMPIAYGLAVAGASDADGDGSMFDGKNAVAGQFAASSTPHSSIYDDQSITVGITELFTRLGCASRLAEVNSAARATYAAYDTDRFAARYVDFRNFAISVRKMNLQGAKVGVFIASADLAIAVGTNWSGLALTAATGGAAAPAQVAAALAMVAAIATEVQAIASVVLAENALTLAQSKLGPAQAFKAGTTADLVAASARAKALDLKGLLP